MMITHSLTIFSHSTSHLIMLCIRLAKLEQSGVRQVFKGNNNDNPFSNDICQSTLSLIMLCSRLAELEQSGVRQIFKGHNSDNPFSNDIEPEYITFNADETKAYVSLQVYYRKIRANYCFCDHKLICLLVGLFVFCFGLYVASILF